MRLMVAGAGLTLGAVAAMAAFHDRRFRCGPSKAYTFAPGGLTAGTGLLITLAGWGELHRTPREKRAFGRAPRILLPLLGLTSVALGAAPIFMQPVVCSSN